MARQRRPFVMQIDQQQTGHLVDQGRAMSNQFVIRVRGDRLTGHWPSNGPYDSPPQLAARIEQHPDGLVINGTVRESFNDAMWQPAFLGLTVFMVLLAVFGVVTLITGYASGGLPPLLIGVIAAPAFGLLWRRFKRTRHTGFDRQVRELEDGMREALRTGTSNRRAL